MKRAILAACALALLASATLAQNAPLSGLEPRGTPQSSDLIPVLPAGAPRLESMTVGDLAGLINAGLGTGSVTTVTCGTGLSGGTFTVSGTCALAANGVALGDIATIGANTVLGNFTGATADVAAQAMPSCADSAGQHLNYVSGTGFACGTSVPAPPLSPLGEVSYLYVPSILGKVADAAGVPAATTGAGNGIIDVAGGVWTITANTALLTGTTDTVDGSQFLRDWGTLPAAATPSGLSQTMVVDLDPTDAANVFAVFRAAADETNSGYFIGTNNGGSGGGAIIYAYQGGTLEASASGSASGFVTGHALRVIAMVSGSSPTTVTATVIDMVTGATISTATLSDSTSGLQAASSSAIAIRDSAGAASAQSAVIQRIAAYDPTVAVKPLYVAFVGDSLLYGEKVSDAPTNGGTIVGDNPAAQTMSDLSSFWGGVNLGNKASREDQTATMMAPALPLASATRLQNWALVMSSVNDAIQSYTADQMKEQLIALTGQIRALGYRVIVSTLVPVGSSCSVCTDSGTNGTAVNALLAVVNPWIRANWRSFADALADPAADSRLSAYSSTYWASDELHLNDTGSAVLGSIWATALTAAANDFPQMGPTPLTLTQAPADGATSATFSIPSGYSDFEITVRGASKASAAYDVVSIRFNGDGGTNYTSQQIVYNNATFTGAGQVANSSIMIGWLPGATGVSNGGSHATAMVAGYGGSTYIKSVTSQGGVRTGTTASGLFEQVDWGDWNNIAPITSLTVNLAGGFKAGSSVSVRMIH